MVVMTLFVWLSFGMMDFGSASDDITYSMATWMTAAGVSVLLVQFIFFFQTKMGGTIGFCGYHRGIGQERPVLTFLTETFPSASTTKSEEDPDFATRPPASSRKTCDTDFDSVPTTVQESSAKPSSLLSLQESFDCYIDSGKKSVPLIYALVVSWAAKNVYLSLGMDRITAGWILSDGMTSELLPIVTFFSCFLLSSIIGSSYTTIFTLIPILTAPALEISEGSLDVFAAFLGSLVSGAVAGCHFGPFTETTVLSGFLAESGVRGHFLSKIPFASSVLVVASVVGTIPVSLGAYPDYVGLLIGAVTLSIFLILVCRRSKSASNQSPNASDAITQSRFGFGQRTGGVNELAGKKIHSLQSFKSKLREVAEKDGDPIQELVEDGLLPQNIRELDSFASGSTATPVVHNRTRTRSLLQNQKRLVEATIRESDNEGNVFTPSLRNYLRTADTKLDKMMDEEEESVSLENDGSGSGDDDDDDGEEDDDGSQTDGSHTDDSLDNLMMNIASKGWSAVRQLTGVANTAEDDGNSTDNGDSYMSTTSYSVGNGHSTAYTGVTSFTEDDGETNSLPSQSHSVTSSNLQKNVVLNRTRDVKAPWLNGAISSEADDSTVEASKASF
jgi:Na+/H+ antiporter family